MLADVALDRWSAASSAVLPSTFDGSLSLIDAYQEIVRRCGGDHGDDKLIRALADLDEEVLLASARLYPDAEEFLRALRAKGVATVLVSNCGPSARRLLQSLGLLGMVDGAVLSCEVKSQKPEPAIFRACLAAIGVPAESAILVDDQPAYCEGAERTGIDTILIARQMKAPDGSQPSRRPTVRTLVEASPIVLGVEPGDG